MQFVLLAVLLLAALFIVVAVVFQKSSDEGLSSTISGGNESFYGKDKAAHTDKILYKWTLVAAIVFALAVLIAYVIQPDISNDIGVDGWKTFSSWGSTLFE